MINIYTILLIHKVLSGEASPKETLELETWTEKSSDNESYYSDMKRVFSMCDSIEKVSPDLNKDIAKAKLFSRIDDELLNFEKKSQNPQTKIFNLKIVTSIAATLIIIIGAIFVMNTFNESDIILKSNQTVSYFELSDNSKIWLDKNSSLKVDVGFDDLNRSVTLVGNAYFDISKNAKLPFEISVLDNKIIVEGTSFQVYSLLDKRVEVNVYSGKVMFIDSDKKRVILQENQGVILDKVANKISKIVESRFKSDFRDSYLTFIDTPLVIVFEHLSNYFNIEINSNCDDISTMIGYTSPSYAGENVKDYFNTIQKLYNIKIEKVSKGVYKAYCD